VGNRGEDGRKAIFRYLQYSHLGIQFLVALLLPIGLGVWLDRLLGTRVLFTLLGMALGFTAGIYSIYGELYRRRAQKPRGGDGGGRDEGSGKDPSPK
jgi:F0F1-type ATP synthase assembly protein I